MVRVLMLPQVNDNYRFHYEFEDEYIKVELYQFIQDADGIHQKLVGEEVYDFTDMSDGMLQSVDSKIKFVPILNATKQAGHLSVELLYFISSKESDETILYPKWRDINE